VLANEDLYDGIVYDDVRKIFKGYGVGVRSSWPHVIIQCSDLTAFFDRAVTLRDITSISVGYPAIDPAVTADGSHGFVPRLWGYLQGL
jgi:hypothetical protein